MAKKKTKKQTGAKKTSAAPLKICDTTLRDGHQSSLATRMRFEDMAPLLEDIDKIGFHSLEVWGGATFDVCTRFLNEDPWERLANIRKVVRNTKLQMLLRGQNLVGYRNYADDVVDAFVQQTAEAGLDIFRVFDALNDERNYEAAFKAIKKTGKEIQATISYALTERRMGGPIFNLEYFLGKAKTFESMGADSLCLKDMAGIIAPMDAYDLIRALKETVKMPIQLHTHYTSGMGSMSYLKAVEAGVDIIDCSLAPFALRSSQPAVEPIVVALQGSPRDPGLDLQKLVELGRKLEEVTPKYRRFLNQTRMAVIDTNVLEHQIPGGMLSNLVNQMREAGALDRINEVYEELPRTRADLGYPPLVTPTSQIVGIQAVQNVLFGRYKMVTGQVKDYVYGLYGRPPAPISDEIRKLILKDYPKGDKPIEVRPGDLLEPELDAAREAIKDISTDIKDILIYALFPTTGMRFLRWKYGLEPVPDDVKPITIEEAKECEEVSARALKGDVDVKAKPKTAAPKRGPNLRNFNVFVEGEYYNVEVEEVGGKQFVRSIGAGQRAKPSAHAEVQPSSPAPATVSAPASTELDEGEVGLFAPMPGMVISYSADKGGKVKLGETFCVLEAMKMQNNLAAPATGTVKLIAAAAGAAVEKNQLLAVIST
ncbi:MAG: pyruvate carboxylase subunit B [Planctomycetota bacterium]|nr:MAG: pyruvate carboxylase subunit B [Planctomycetota bacterium]